jgi:hypothetical protein
MSSPTPRLLLALLLAVALLGAQPRSAPCSPAEEYLTEATSATVDIRLPGDQSAALQWIARVTLEIDPEGALGLVVRMRRPSDAARLLCAAAVALNDSQPGLSDDSVRTAGQLLLRISDTDHRMMEQRLALWEMGALGSRALPAATELSPGEAQYMAALGSAKADPAALALVQEWELTGRAADTVLATAAEGLALEDPDSALVATDGIVSAPVRDAALRRVCEQRPAAEVAGIALRISNPVSQSAALSEAAARLAKTDLDAALALVTMIEVARESALADVAVAAADSQTETALEIARGLSSRAREWALSRIAVGMAAADPERAWSLLAEAGTDSGAACLAIGRIVATDPGRASELAGAMPPGADRDAALAMVARAIAAENPELAEHLIWDIASPNWRALAVESVAVLQAPTDVDAATGLIGLVSASGSAAWIRARVALAVAADSALGARRLIASLPSSLYRTDAAVMAMALALAADEEVSTAYELGALGLEKELALRWALPAAAQAQVRSPLRLAEEISDPYLRAMALADTAGHLVHLESRARPVPDRMLSIRPVVEWAER